MLLRGGTWEMWQVHKRSVLSHNVSMVCGTKKKSHRPLINPLGGLYHVWSMSWACNGTPGAHSNCRELFFMAHVQASARRAPVAPPGHWSARGVGKFGDVHGCPVTVRRSPLAGGDLRAVRLMVRAVHDTRRCRCDRATLSCSSMRARPARKVGRRRWRMGGWSLTSSSA